MRKDRKLSVLAVTLNTFSTKGKPIWKGEIYRLIEVELTMQTSTNTFAGKRSVTYAMVEAGVICLREGDYKFACTLVACVDADVGILHSLGIHERHELEE